MIISRRSSAKKAVTALSAVVLFALPRASMAVSPEQGWVLDRRNNTGHEIVYIDSTAVKIYYPDLHLNVVSVAPFHDIAWFDPVKKVIFKDSLEQYEKSKGVPPNSRPLKLEMTPTKYAGVKAFKIIQRGKQQKFELSLPLPSSGDTKASNIVVQTTYYVTDAVNLPELELRFINRFFGLPNTQGLPLACYQELADGKRSKSWFTQSISRQILKKEMFQIPLTYKKVSSVTSVGGAAPPSTKALDDMLNDLGVGEEFGAKRVQR